MLLNLHKHTTRSQPSSPFLVDAHSTSLTLKGIDCCLQSPVKCVPNRHSSHSLETKENNGRVLQTHHVLVHHPRQIMGEAAKSTPIALSSQEIETYPTLPAVIVYDGIDVMRKFAVSPCAPAFGEVEANLILSAFESI